VDQSVVKGLLRRGTRAALLPLLLSGLAAIAVGCGVKAAPRPPGVKAATRGERAPDCEGCEIPGPDAYPSPSTPSIGTGSAGLPTQEDGDESPEGEEGAGGTAGAEADDAAESGA